MMTGPPNAELVSGLSHLFRFQPGNIWVKVVWVRVLLPGLGTGAAASSSGAANATWAAMMTAAAAASHQRRAIDRIGPLAAAWDGELTVTA